MLVQLSDVHFGYPGTDLFDGVSWQLNPGDRVGLVGPNGAGKSTLLRLLDGKLTPDRGNVSRAKGVTVAYLHQSQEFHGAGTLWDTLMAPFADLLEMRAELSRLEHSLTEADLARYGHLQEIYTRRDGYTLESRVRQLASELGFTDDDLARNVSTLSGGERGRVELAKVLLAAPDLLLLDEPTNHLDVEAVEHLEERLADWPGAFVLVSHDRYFLRATCREIVDVAGGRIDRYPGGYDKYVVEHQERLERAASLYRRQQESIAKTEDFIRRNIAGQNTKQAQSRRKQLERMERSGQVLERPRDDWAEAGNFRLRFSTGDHKGGKDALRAESITVGYPGAPPVVTGLDCTIYRGERIGIVGPNGCGKTTLMKTLLGLLEPRAGKVTRGVELQIGYFDQKLGDLDESRSLLDEIRAVRGDWNEDVVRNYLGMFRFSGDDAFRKVKGLSGGERNRMALAKMMLLPRNLLALDEPTNHLDIPAREVLEEALSEYDGTILVVSHDRFFLDRICHRLLQVHDGKVEQHAGNYTEWKQRTRQKKAPPPPQKVVAAVEKKVEAKEARAVERDQKKAADRDRQKKERRLADLEKEIATAEAKLAEARAALSGDHAGDWQRLNSLVEEERKLANRVKSLMGEWEKLGSELS
jgi:ATP-binding cassette subfamily F protein 3